MTLDHVSVRVRDMDRSRTFYTAVLAPPAAGPGDSRAPRLRPLCHASDAGAFVFDPDGNNAEAVCHLPED